MNIRLLHCGDLHIGSFPGPEKDGQNARFQDICRYLDILAEEVKEKEPDIAVIAGDVFHQARVWSDRGLKEQQAAVNFFRKLKEICPVVVLRGTPNHDSAEQFRTLKNTFAGDNSVHIVTEPSILSIKTRYGENVELACLPGLNKGYFRTQNPGLSKEEENKLLSENIKKEIIKLKERCHADALSVLVSHYTIAGCNMESGQTAFSPQFEPVVSAATLKKADFDLACFGHIHRPQKIKGCKNTFYCGAISAINFGDEGQKRGYWIHDMENGEVTSVFQELPTREFFTIQLKDDDIREINDNGPGYLLSSCFTDGTAKIPVLENKDKVKEKIVRVLYSCTDEHNKAFHHARLEDWLYEVGGAFWVQEISPQKISIAVDRRSMDANNTPEDNLKAHLIQKEVSPEKIKEVLDLATPILEEVTEDTSAESRTGIFVPVEIEVKNYRNYREGKFSFDDVLFCIVTGENGAGKSSIFMDAMMDALFEEPREGDLTGWICNAPGVRSGSIKFTFRLGKRTYRVTRTRTKSGKGMLNIAEMVNGAWEDRSKEKLRDTQTAINELIVLDSLTLKSCALIMQDRYGLFLEADKETRMNVLGSILGLENYTRMEALAANRATEVNREIRILTDKLESITAGLPDKSMLDVQIKNAEEKKAHLEEQMRQKTAETDILKAQLNLQIEAANRVIKLRQKLASLKTQKSDKEKLKTLQEGMVATAEAILAKESDIIAGVVKYNTLVEREREFIKEKVVYDNLCARKKQLMESITQLSYSIENTNQKKSSLVQMRIIPLQQALAAEEELSKKHADYLVITAQIAEMERYEPEWKKFSEAVTSAKEKVYRLEREHDLRKTQSMTTINALKAKVQLLKDSGCPFPENATCKFLADALEAKEKLPVAESKFTSIEQEYAESYRKAEESLSLAKNALENCPYHLDKLEALRKNLKDLESSEKEYAALAGKQNELRLLEEHVAELEKNKAVSEDHMKEKRADLENIDDQINKMATVFSDYDRLQQQMIENRHWIEDEKQLPAAKECKKTAVSRIQELDNEIRSLDEEILDMQIEFSQEMKKSTDKDILQVQVKDAEEEIRNLQTLVQDAAEVLGRLKLQAEQVKKNLDEATELRKQIKESGNKASGYEILKQAFSQSGIPHNIVRSIIPVLETTATNILGQMSQGHMSVEFVMDKTLKSNSKKEVTTLDVIINDSNSGRLPYASKSGGEKVKAALAVILAISEIKSRKTGIQLGFLFIDEAPFLDVNGTQAYVEALKTIQQRYADTKVMAITHDESLKDYFPQNITVYKDENGSHIKNN